MPDRVKWWEPYRETCGFAICELRSAGVLRPVFWVRSVAVSLVIIGALVAWMVAAYPGIVLPWPTLLGGLVVAPAALAMVLGINAFAPRHIEVRRGWIQITHGQDAVRIKREQIEAVTLVEDAGPPRLTVTYRTRRGKVRTRSAAVGSSVDLDSLAVLVDSFHDPSPPDPA